MVWLSWIKVRHTNVGADGYLWLEWRGSKVAGDGGGQIGFEASVCTRHLNGIYTRDLLGGTILKRNVLS